MSNVDAALAADWLKILNKWSEMVPIKLHTPPSETSLANARQSVRGFASFLERLYKVTNGLDAGVFKLLPVEDSLDIKRTWDSIQRANDPRRTRFLGRSSELLDRFIVFADIGVGRAGVVDRNDGSVWYEDGIELRQTNLRLKEFVELNLREIAQR